MLRQKIVLILDYVLEYSMYAVIFFIPISKAAIECFLTLAFLCFLLKKLLGGDFHVFKTWPYLFLGSFIFFCALSLLNSGYYFPKSFVSLILKWMEYVGCFLFVNEALINRKRLRNAVIIFLFISLLIGLDGISQRYLGLEFMRNREMVKMPGGLYGITGPFNHYNDFGAYLIVALSLVLALLISTEMKKKYRWALGVQAAFLGMSLMMTYSRGSWLGMILALLFMLFLSKRPKSLVLPFVIFICLLIMLPQVRQRLISTFETVGDADRIGIWKSAIAMIKENPFLGKGIGTFMDYFNKYAPDRMRVAQYAHNCYLQIWAETGIFSLLSFLLFLGSLLLMGIKSFLRSRNHVILGLISAIFAFSVHSFFDTDLYSLQLAVLFWVLAGLIYAFSALEQQEAKNA